jgi:hypothetical protein
MLNLLLLFTLISTGLLLHRYIIYSAFVSLPSKIPVAPFTALVFSLKSVLSAKITRPEYDLFLQLTKGLV